MVQDSTMPATEEKPSVGTTLARKGSSSSLKPPSLQRRPSTGNASVRSNSSTSTGAKMSSAMLVAKNDRKRAEADVQLLANRLAHLRAEEEKAQRKVDDTRRRAKEILQHKRRNEDKERKREAQLQQQHKVGAEGQQRIQRAKSVQSKQLEATKQGLTRARKAAAQGARKEKQELLLNYEEVRAKQMEDNRKRNEVMRQRREVAKLKKEQEEDERKRRQQREYEARLEREAARAKAAVEQIAKMEADEDAMIERLRKAQDEQRRAYEELQASLEV